MKGICLIDLADTILFYEALNASRFCWNSVAFYMFSALIFDEAMIVSSLIFWQKISRMLVTWGIKVLQLGVRAALFLRVKVPHSNSDECLMNHVDTIFNFVNFNAAESVWKRYAATFWFFEIMRHMVECRVQKVSTSRHWQCHELNFKTEIARITYAAQSLATCGNEHDKNNAALTPNCKT